MGVWIGLGEAKELLKLQLFLNGLNMVLDILPLGFWGSVLMALLLAPFFRDHHLPGRVLPIATIPRRETRGWCGWHAFWPMERVREMTQCGAC